MESLDELLVWVLAPIQATGEVDGEDTFSPPSQSTNVLENSTSDRLRYLSLADERFPELEVLGCSMVTKHSVGVHELISALVRIPLRGLEASPDEVKTLVESSCRMHVDRLVNDICGPSAHALWVNRTLVLKEFNGTAEVWANSGSREIHLGEIEGGNMPAMVVSWANNVVLLSAFNSVQVGPMIRAGMVDAQAIWCDVEEVSQEANALVENQVVAHDALKLGDGRTERLLMDLARHNLLYDDLLFNAPRARMIVATSVLDSWRYSTVRERLDGRIRDADALERRRRLRREARHEKRVSTVLLLLSLVSGAQLILAVVALAYTGAVDVFPGARDGSVFETVRKVDADLWLGLTLLSVVMLYGIVQIPQRKGE